MYILDFVKFHLIQHWNVSDNETKITSAQVTLVIEISEAHMQKSTHAFFMKN
jgi:hypothetical protein